MRVLLLLLVLQDSESGSGREWIERLRSDQIEEREEAIRRLKSLGSRARAELEKAARDPDPEVADTASRLIFRIQIPDTLSARLKKAFPGVEDKLAFGGHHAWTDVFLHLARKDLRGNAFVARFPELRKEDLEPLAERAFRGAADDAEKEALCLAVELWELRGSIPDIEALLDDDDPVVRKAALLALGHLGAKRSAPRIARRLKDRSSYLRRIAVWALAVVDAGDQASGLVEIVKDPDEETGLRVDAVWSLGVLDAKDATPEIRKLLRHDDPSVRTMCEKALGVLHSRDSKDAIRKRMGLGR